MIKTAKKRSGEVVPFDLDKIHKSIAWGCHGIKNVSESEVELNAQLQFEEGGLTSDYHKSIIKSAANLISPRTPNYQYVAAKLLLMEVRKDVFGQFEPLPLIDTVHANIKRGLYEDFFLSYTADEINHFDSKIQHKKDFDFTYAGLRTVLDKFTLKDKLDNDRLFESPQQLFMLVSMAMFKNEGVDRSKLVVEYYHELSDFIISLPSPIMSGLRTTVKGYSSCCLIDTGDSKESLTAANSAAVIMTSIKAGIGLFGGSIRGIGAGVANNTVIHTGNVPILKWFEAGVKSFSQGARGGSATIYYPFWHWEIEKIITLKSNKSTPENSVRKLDYGVGLNKLLFDRAAANDKITLFSAEETPDLIKNLYDYDLWLETYLKYERKQGIRKNKISAREFLTNYATEYFETGRLYPLFLDNANNGPLKDVIKMSNLCAEILLPTKELQNVDDPNGEIALCILSNVNAGRIKTLDKLERTAQLLVRGLDNLIDIQEYPLPSAENPTINARYLGIGVSDWAHALTRHKVRYDSSEALDLAEEFMEHWQYNLLKASNELAKERGEANWFRERSKYADGWLPNDGKWCFIPKKKWEALRKSIVVHGLRNNTLSAIPPAGTSSDVSNSTSGIDMPRDWMVTKKSKSGPMKQIVPNFSKGSSYYTLAFEVDNIKYLNMVARFQLYVDQSISTNTYWDEKDFNADGKMPMSKLVRMLKHAHKIGMKSLYYMNFDDSSFSKEDKGEGVVEESCEGGGCSV